MIKAMIKQSLLLIKHLLLFICVKNSEQEKSNFYIKVCLILLLQLSILAGYSKHKNRIFVYKRLV